MQYKVLCSASSSGHGRLVQMTLEEGLDVNAKDVSGTYARPSFLDNEADREFEKCGMDAVNRAASNGHEQVVQILLDYGDDIYFSGWYGGPSLSEAAGNQHKSMMRFLFNREADLKVEGCGEHAFFSAVTDGHEQVVRVLVDTGVNINCGHGPSTPAPILSAMMHGHKHMIKPLIELGAKRVDPLYSPWAEKFLDGTYPPPLLSTHTKAMRKHQQRSRTFEYTVMLL